MKIITRFAPSPTGLLHIGGARTALFNWLFSKVQGGEFLLRIEDTDNARSTPEAVQAIFDGLNWLGLHWDGEAVFQSARVKRHIEVVEQLLDTGNAYRCYLSSEEIDLMKRDNPYKKIVSPWRDNFRAIPKGVPYTVRLRADTKGETIIHDKVRGEVKIGHAELDDMILLRSDGTPTYMLAVVVDDYDMKVTHVLRGDDHFTNTFRQQQIVRALGWPALVYAHIPLIHGADGTKLSKRHGALGIDWYRKAGYLPEAMCNYLLRLGWSSGDREIIKAEDAVKLFTLEGINAAPARFDLDKLNALNAHYIANAPTGMLMQRLRIDSNVVSARVMQAMPDLKIRANTLIELQDLADLYLKKNHPVDAKSQEVLSSCSSALLLRLEQALMPLYDWTIASVKNQCVEFATVNDFSGGRMMQILRAVVVGSFKAPGIYETMEILGKEEVCKRIKDTVALLDS